MAEGFSQALWEKSDGCWHGSFFPTALCWHQQLGSVGDLSLWALIPWAVIRNKGCSIQKCCMRENPQVSLAQYNQTVQPVEMVAVQWCHICAGMLLWHSGEQQWGALGVLCCRFWRGERAPTSVPNLHRPRRSCREVFLKSNSHEGCGEALSSWAVLLPWAQKPDPCPALSSFSWVPSPWPLPLAIHYWNCSCCC